MFAFDSVFIPVTQFLTKFGGFQRGIEDLKTNIKRKLIKSTMSQMKNKLKLKQTQKIV